MTQLASKGYVFAHFILDQSHLADDAESIQRALADTEKKWNSEEGFPALEGDHAIVSVPGQCDLLLRFSTTDFRFASILQTSAPAPHSYATSWLYAIPYEGPYPQVSPSPNSLEYVLYFSVHRVHYLSRSSKAEEDIERGLRERLGESLGPYRIFYSLGWPDLVVHGSLATPLNHLTEKLKQLHEFTLPIDGEEVPVFRRTLTLLGVHSQGTQVITHDQQLEESGILIRPIIRARCRSGMIEPSRAALLQLFKQLGVSSVEIDITDGTWDLIVRCRQDAAIDLRFFNHALQHKRATLTAAGIERTQTHILVSGESTPMPLLGNDTVSDLPNITDSKAGCLCSTIEFRTIQSSLKEAEHSHVISGTLYGSLSYVVAMFLHATRESSSCCDVAPSISAHLTSLQDLLDLAAEYKAISLASELTHDQRNDAFHRLLEYREHLRLWCTLGGRILRERTAGAFERLFRQIDSVVAQRGSIPKILFITEGLMKGFYRSIPGSVTGIRETRDRTFSAVYEPQAAVSSHPSIGLVNIPLRYAFSLHLVLPQIWHEVAEFIFYERFLKNRARRLQFEETLAALKEKVAQADVDDLTFRLDYELRVDMFSDLLVFKFGFQENFVFFLDYLVKISISLARNEKMPEKAWERHGVAILTRLIYVAQFRFYLETLRKREHHEQEDLRLARQQNHADLLRGIEASARRLNKHAEKIAKKFRRSDEPFEFTARMASTVRQNFRQSVVLEHLESLMFDLAEEVGIHDSCPVTTEYPSSAWGSLTQGELIQIETPEELSELYLELYRNEILKDESQARNDRFRLMASLGRSALLSLYAHNHDRIGKN